MRLNAIVADKAPRLTVGIPAVTMDPAGIQVPAFCLRDVEVPPPKVEVGDQADAPDRADET